MMPDIAGCKHPKPIAMESLIIPQHIFESMLMHVKQGYPDEACGILAGKSGKVSKIYTIANSEKSPLVYEMDSKEHFAAIKDMRENQLSMMGIFHSHPASPAYPSGKDISIAFYEDAVYIIISLMSEPPAAKGFSIKNSAVKEVELIIM